MPRYTAALVISFLFLLATPTGSVSDSQLTPTMHEMGAIMIRLIPWAYQEKEQIPPYIHGDIGKLALLFSQSAAHFKEQPIGVKLNYDLLNEQLDGLSANAKTYGSNSLRLMLKDTFAQCMSCHGQDQLQRRPFSEIQLRQLANGFAKAELFFMTRDYANALQQYLEYLKVTRPDVKSHNRLIAFERILVLAAQANADLEKARYTLSQAADLTSNQFEVSLVKDWLTSLEEITKGSMSPINAGHLRIEDLSEFIELKWPAIKGKSSWHRQQVYWVMLRRYLHQYIAEHQYSIDMPKLLYWLAMSDRSLQFKFYDALSRLYLLECITGYTDHPYAKQCFDEYELLMIVSFSGSAGLTIPDDVQQEIESLRKLVYSD
jgi:hypothetical protein